MKRKQLNQKDMQDKPPKVNIQQALYDFDETIKTKPNLTDKELMSKFPEFKNDTKLLQSAYDYSATLNSGKYKDVLEFNSKFPEFSDLKKKDKISEDTTKPLSDVSEGLALEAPSISKPEYPLQEELEKETITQPPTNKTTVGTLIGEKEIPTLTGKATAEALVGGKEIPSIDFVKRDLEYEAIQDAIPNIESEHQAEKLEQEYQRKNQRDKVELEDKLLDRLAGMKSHNIISLNQEQLIADLKKEGYTKNAVETKVNEIFGKKTEVTAIEIGAGLYSKKYKDLKGETKDGAVLRDAILESQNRFGVIDLARLKLERKINILKSSGSLSEEDFEQLTAYDSELRELLGKSQMYDRETGMRLNAPKEEQVMEQAIGQEYQKLKSLLTDKEKLEREYIKRFLALEGYNESSRRLETDVRGTYTGEHRAAAFLGAENQYSDYKNKSENIQRQQQQAQLRFDAISRMFLLNENPAEYVKDITKPAGLKYWQDKVGKGLTKSILGEKLGDVVADKVFDIPDAEIMTVTEDVLGEADIQLTDEEKENLKISFIEKAVDMGVGLSGVVIKLAIANKIQGAIGLTQLFSALKKGSTINKVQAFVGEALLEGVKFEAIGGEAASGTGFYVTQRLMPNIMIKNPVVNKIVNAIYKNNIGMTTAMEGAEVFNSVVTALRNETPIKEELNKHFGDIDEVTERVLLGLTVNWMFTGKEMLSKSHPINNVKKLESAKKDILKNKPDADVKFLDKQIETVKSKEEPIKPKEEVSETISKKKEAPIEPLKDKVEVEVKEEKIEPPVEEKVDKEIKAFVEQAKKYETIEEFEKDYTASNLMDLTAPERHRLGRIFDEVGGEEIMNTVDVVNEYGKDLGYTPNANVPMVKNKNETVTIYRMTSKEQKDMLAGDFVSFSKEYAEGHNVEGHLLKKEVPAKDVIWQGNDFNEWVYSPEKIRKKYPKGLADIYSESKEEPIKPKEEVSETISEKKEEVKEPVKLQEIKEKELTKKEETKLKKVSVSKAKAMEEVLGIEKFKDLGKMEAGILSNKFKDADIYEPKEEGLEAKIFEKLEKKGYIKYTGDYLEYELTETGKSFIKAVKARHETRKAVKEGTDLFPEHAEIPELKKENISIKEIEQETIKTAEEKVKPVVDFVRSLKTTPPGSLKTGTGLGEAWDASMEIIAKSIEGGAKVIDAISKGLVSLKKSKWYKELTKEKQEEIEKGYNEYWKEQLIEKKSKKTEVQEAIDKEVEGKIDKKIAPDNLKEYQGERIEADKPKEFEESKIEKFEEKEKPDTKTEERPKTSSSYEKLEDDWFGNKDWETTKASIEAQNYQEKIQNTIKEKPVGAKTFPGKWAKEWKDIDKAIHVYLDMKRNPEHLDLFYDKLTKEQKGIVNKAQNLTPEQKQIAEDISKEYEKIGLDAMDAGVIQNVLDNYVARSWNLKGKSISEFYRKFGVTTKHAKRRTLETILEGWAKGYELQVEGATNNLSILKSEIHATIENKKLVQEGLKIKDPDGNKIFSFTQLDGYKEIEHSNFTHWGYEGKIKSVGSEREMEILGKRKDILITPDGTILRKQRIYAPKKIAKDLNKVLGVSKLKGIKVIDQITKFNAVTKAWILQSSFFHHLAFTRSYLFGGALEKFSDLNPVGAYKKGLKALKAMTPEVELLVRNGLTIGRIQDWSENLIREKTIISKQLDKLKVTKVVKNKIVDMQQAHTNFLFNKYGAGLKMYTALLEYKKLLKHAPQLEPNERAKLASNLVNDDFGGLHLERMKRDKTGQHIFRLFALAPDWTESNVRSMVKAFKGGTEGKLYRKFWGRIATRGMMLTTAANLLLAMWDDEDENGNKIGYVNAVKKRYKRAWDKGGLRWLEVDITPIYRGLGGDKENISYFSILGHFKDPVKFVTNPITSAHHKGSVVYRLFHEALVGTDWRGRGFTNWDELAGLDEKGVYKTTKKGKYKKGDSKGGKLKGELTKFELGGGSPLEYGQFPSYVLHELRGMQPIQIQNLIYWLTGEMDGIQAIGKSLGFHMAVTKPPKKNKETPKTFLTEEEREKRDEKREKRDEGRE